MNRKAFILWDSLFIPVLTIFIVSMCLSLFNALKNYNEGYDEYLRKSNEKFEALFQGIQSCEKKDIP